MCCDLNESQRYVVVERKTGKRTIVHCVFWLLEWEQQKTSHYNALRGVVSGRLWECVWETEGDAVSKWQAQSLGSGQFCLVCSNDEQTAGPEKQDSHSEKGSKWTGSVDFARGKSNKKKDEKNKTKCNKKHIQRWTVVVKVSLYHHFSRLNMIKAQGLEMSVCKKFIWNMIF